MSDRKIIAVVGATGAQGGGLARAILNDPGGGFIARALTRRVNSARASEIGRLGAEVVFADADDEESMGRAFAGAYGAFCVTNFWEHLSPDREIAQARSMAQAAMRTGLQHVIWSTLEDTRRWVPLADPRIPTLAGRYKVPHFDAKGEANEIFERLVPTTCLLTSFYWDNFIGFPGMALKRAADRQVRLALPMADKKLPGIAAEDIGRCAYGILTRSDELVGRTVGIAGEHLTGFGIAEKLARALGEPVVYDAVLPDVYRQSDMPHARELGNMFQFKRDFEAEFCGARSVEFSRTLNPHLETFDLWLARSKDRIRII